MLEADAAKADASDSAASARMRVSETSRGVKSNAVRGPGRGRTLTRPCIMTPWTVQKYVNVRAVLKVCVNVKGGL